MFLNMSDTDLELLARYSRLRAEEDFAELVRRHVDLVHSAALRQVRSPELAEEVAQSTFLKLAQHAPQLASGTVLAAWLYQVARRESIDVVRREARRQLREQIAIEMHAMNATDDDWTHIEPLLDDAMHALDDIDRAAVLLRYFENRSLREVGEALGASEDAARKRISRAVERLREFFAERGVSVGATGLAAVLSANAVQAAPAGLCATITSAAALAGASASVVVSTTTTATQAIAMTTLQKTLAGTALVAAISVAVFQTREAARLRDANEEQHRQQASLAGELARLKEDHAAVNARLAALSNQPITPRTNASEVLKLRGQVGVLRQEKAELGRKSALSKVTADPTSRKAMRDQQKMGMKSLYGDLVKRLGLAPEQQEQFHDLLADDVMANIDLITQSLQDKTGAEEIDRMFSAQETALRDKLSELLGPDGLTQYRDYTKDLGGTITAMQFEGKLNGEKAERAAKKQRLLDSMREETVAALAAAGLRSDHQPLPMLDYRNIASEKAAERSLGMMADVYERVAGRADAYLSPEEVKQLREFGKKAVDNNRTMLLMNRKLMAPIAE